MHIPVSEGSQNSTSSGWDLPPQNASSGCDTLFGTATPLDSWCGVLATKGVLRSLDQAQLQTLLSALWLDPCWLTAWWRAFTSTLLPN